MKLQVHRRKTSSIAGFTLLEALIATALMGFVLAAIATITSQWLPNWNRGFVRVQRSEQLALGLERIAADLSAAEFIPISREVPQPYFDGEARSVTFVRTALGPNAGIGLEIIRIAEVTGEQGPVLVRTRALYIPMGMGTTNRDPPNFKDPVVLIRPPYRFAFSYAGVDRIWRDSWRRQVRLPKAIKLSLRDAAMSKTISAITILLHNELPQTCITAKSLDACVALRPLADSGKSRS